MAAPWLLCILTLAGLSAAPLQGAGDRGDAAPSTEAALTEAPAAAEPRARRDLTPLLERVRAEHDLPALAALVLTADGPVADGYAGTCERDGTTPVARGDRFHLGSCTKAMTATLIARYVEDGTLRWDTTVGATFPELVEAMHPAWPGVTLAQLLAHTAGAPADLRAFPPLALAVTLGQKELTELRAFVVRDVTQAEPAFEPGTSWLYSNWGYVIAGAMLEAETGEAWETLMAERLFEPLGMTTAGFGAPRADPPRAGSSPAEKGADEDARGPCGHDDKGRPRPGLDNPATVGPAGTVHGTLDDWARFARLHLRGARGDEELLLAPESFAFLHAPQPGSQGTYGGGWMVARRPWSEGTLLAHNGSNTFWFTWVWIAPEEGFAVLVATNQGGDRAAAGSDAAAWALIQDHLVSEGAGASERAGANERARAAADGTPHDR